MQLLHNYNVDYIQLFKIYSFCTITIPTTVCSSRKYMYSFCTITLLTPFSSCKYSNPSLASENNIISVIISRQNIETETEQPGVKIFFLFYCKVKSEL